VQPRTTDAYPNSRRAAANPDDGSERSSLATVESAAILFQDLARRWPRRGILKRLVSELQSGVQPLD
jgi:hypothetical protein